MFSRGLSALFRPRGKPDLYLELLRESNWGVGLGYLRPGERGSLASLQEPKYGQEPRVWRKCTATCQILPETDALPRN